MIQLIVRLGKYLESRFPPKLVVTSVDWLTLKTQMDVVQGVLSEQNRRLAALEANVELVLSRLSRVETNAVHKGAVADVVLAMKTLKEEVGTLKTGLGLTRVGNAEVQALLNGEYISGEGQQ
jgi:hypothetical protein